MGLEQFLPNATRVAPGADEARLLVVEDDGALCAALTDALRLSGYSVHACASGEAALVAVANDGCDGMVLDVGLPGIDGFDVLRALRRDGWTFPILMLTARDSTQDRVNRLMQGADDYMVKPFAIDELLARIHILIRRRAERASPMLRMGRVTMDVAAKRTFFDGDPVELPLREWGILRLLLSSRGRIVSKSVIADGLQRAGGERISDNAIDVYVSRLRSRLQPLDVVIRTVRGFGYLMEEGVPAERRAAPRRR